MNAVTVDAPNPRITIKFCTQCKWMLRAAYFAQELLSTFSTSLGEVALQPSTGGVFTVEIFYLPPSSNHAALGETKIESKILWDRKTEGGFPEVKELKRRVRDIIDPSRDLGHVDGKKKSVAAPTTSTTSTTVTDAAATGHINTEEGAEVHERQSLEGQPGARRHSGVGAVLKSGSEEVVGAGGDDRRRNPDGTVCEDCA